MTTRIILLLIILALVACENKNEVKIEADDSSAVLQQDSIQTVIDKKPALANAPDWYNDLPEREEYIYVSASARSRNASIAEEKADHIARVLMAEKIKILEKDISSSNSHGGALSEDTPNSQPQALHNSIIRKRKRVKEGKYWRVFVLLEMKIKSN